MAAARPVFFRDCATPPLRPMSLEISSGKSIAANSGTRQLTMRYPYASLFTWLCRGAKKMTARGQAGFSPGSTRLRKKKDHLADYKPSLRNLLARVTVVAHYGIIVRVFCAIRVGGQRHWRCGKSAVTGHSVAASAFTSMHINKTQRNSKPRIISQYTKHPFTGYVSGRIFSSIYRKIALSDNNSV